MNGSSSKTDTAEEQGSSPRKRIESEHEDLASGSSCLDLEIGNKEEKSTLRKAIVVVYKKLLFFLSQTDYDSELRKELASNYSIKDEETNKQNYEIVLEERMKDIQRMELGIPIAGETSCGKTSLINKLVGRELFCPKTRPATAKICRITCSPSDEIFLKLSDADDKMIDVEYFADFSDVKKIRNVLEFNSDLKKSTKADPKIHYLDFFCPFENFKAKGNMMLVDTPGIGTSEELTTMLLKYLPSAIAFVFIINVSNAGGVQEDRIVKVLETILRNLYKMPCFEPKDVIFITNKWNMLKDQMKDDDDDDDDDVDEIQETWDDVKKKIKEIWPVFEEDAIFKLYLKTINPNDGTDEERSDFVKFTERLLELSKKNIDSKIEIHLRLLKDDISRIKRGISARIHTAAADDRKRAELEKSLTDTELLKARCHEICHELTAEIYSKVSNLSKTFHAKLKSSESSSDIQKKYHIEEKETVDWKSILRKETIAWMKGNEVLNALDDVEKQISDSFKTIQQEIEEITKLMSGEEDTGKEKNISSPLQKLLEPCPWLPTMNTFAALALFPGELQHSFRGSVSQQGGASLSECLRSYTKEAIESSLKFIFDIHFETRIINIFAKELPMEIESIKATIEHLLLQKSYKKQDLDKWRGLMTDLFDLYEEVDDLMSSP